MKGKLTAIIAGTMLAVTAIPSEGLKHASTGAKFRFNSPLSQQQNTMLLASDKDCRLNQNERDCSSSHNTVLFAPKSPSDLQLETLNDLNDLGLDRSLPPKFYPKAQPEPLSPQFSNNLHERSFRPNPYLPRK